MQVKSSSSLREVKALLDKIKTYKFLNGGMKDRFLIFKLDRLAY